MLLSAIEILINEKNDRRNPFYAKQLVGRETMASLAVWRKVWTVADKPWPKLE